jgi:hypothetical protein
VEAPHRLRDGEHGYNVHTRTDQEDANRANGEDLSIKAEAYRMPGVTIDGRDPVAVHETVGAAVSRARAGDGPTLVESQMYRLSAHGNIIVPPGVPLYFPEHEAIEKLGAPEEYEAAKKGDPVPAFRGRLVGDGTLTAEEAERIADAVREEMQAARRSISRWRVTTASSTSAVVREGGDVTIVALSRLVHDAADRLAAEDGIEAEVIDPRTLVPLDVATICESVMRTGRLVIAHEAVEHGGFGAEIAAQVGAAAFDFLDTPIARVGAPFAPIPLSAPLEDAYLPGADEIVAAARAMLISPSTTT